MRTGACARHPMHPGQLRGQRSGDGVGGVWGDARRDAAGGEPVEIADQAADRGVDHRGGQTERFAEHPQPRERC